jgi:hypothetical protein
VAQVLAAEEAAAASARAHRTMGPQAAPNPGARGAPGGASL